ncbi:hypothetical protein CAR_c11200 [Carnobacterium sp. 17-4]|uniref:hypothetical protein n=1 Tax=Carnobacterium sp. (strain 17-4) TaxID=208596 RepID=UPI0002059246|nr:hypothetical protein [Carnobacterium sp. 17-4]AEB29812.1 hypothetical protein CAR_c11200 [Carnobacterium sp. 17-4]
MKLVITFIDGEELELIESSILNGYVTTHKQNKKNGLEKIFSNSFDGLHTNVFSLIATSTPQLGYASLISEADWITVGKNSEFATFYKTSSIKSISRKLM